MGGDLVTFHEAAKLVRQGVFPDDMSSFPYIGLEHIEEGTLRLIGLGNTQSVTSTKFKFSKGDILFGKLRPYFRKVVRPDFDGVCSTDIWVVRAKPGIDQGYLYYWMASNDFVNFATQGSEGTKMPRAKWEHVGRFQRQRLKESEQRAIAHILGSLDDKIELNHRMNQTLEAISHAIFKSWFVDFDPVRAKAEGLPTGLPDGIAALFPDGFEDSELGEIPKGWNPSNIGSEFDLTMGQSPPGKTYNETGNGLPFFQGCRDFGFRYPSNRVYCTAPQRLADYGDTLVSVRAPVGEINMAMERCCIGRGVAAVRHKSASRSYTYYAMHTLSSRFARYEAEGTVFGAINKKQFEELRWLSFDEKLVCEFEKIAFVLDEEIEKNTNEIATLASLRDMLLPKLISGELRVPDGDIFFEEARL